MIYALTADLTADSIGFWRWLMLLGSIRKISSTRCRACGKFPKFSKPAVAWSSSSIPRSRSPASIRASPSAWCASGSSGSSATRASSSSVVGGVGVASMFVNTREAYVSPWLTTLSRPKSMNADFRVSEPDVSSSVWMNPPVGGMSSTASGSSSTSWPASVIAVSKSGSSSSGGTSTTVFRFGGPGAAGAAAAGRFGTTGLTFGGSAAGSRNLDPRVSGISTRRGDPTPGRALGGGGGGGPDPGSPPGRSGTTAVTLGGAERGRGAGAPRPILCPRRDRLPLGAGRRVHIQEHEAGRLSLSRFRYVFVRRRGCRGCRSPRAPLGSTVHLEMLFQHLPQLGVLRRNVGELLQCSECVLDLADLLHALGVLDEVLVRLRHESLGRVQLGELEIGRLPARRVRQDLVAHRNRVVVEPELGVLVDSPVVVIGRLGGVLHLQIEITDPIEDGQVGVGLPLFLLRSENFQPGLDRPPGVLGLEALGLLFQLLKLRHEGLKIRGPEGADKRTSCPHGGYGIRAHPLRHFPPPGHLAQQQVGSGARRAFAPIGRHA